MFQTMKKTTTTDDVFQKINKIHTHTHFMISHVIDLMINIIFFFFSLFIYLFVMFYIICNKNKVYDQIFKNDDDDSANKIRENLRANNEVIGMYPFYLFYYNVF